jgi:hypothetical protein
MAVVMASFSLPGLYPASSTHLPYSKREAKLNRPAQVLELPLDSAACAKAGSRAALGRRGDSQHGSTARRFVAA